ncbi:NPCBM/NEW2 domain-containing protein [Pontiella agarivorans]|uniref:NPCBM/NEW2 domain-containing protein n=1 Tax=Pontiella agarivorans TaxID=3038953 RepID=A0ABU5MW83_9BACT|nr:NPCBM/NEW2 domain-containing protein [Pontiella agarivorans]MDZ8118467.1 NPCBM/NEW2 domain-containing protein [Pontiella agarivorans]
MNSRAHQLIERFIDENLNEAELLELKALLNTTPEVAQQLTDALHLHGMTALLANSDYAELEKQVDAAIRELAPSEIEQDILRTLHKSPPVKKRRLSLIWGLALAAQIIILLSFFFLTKPSPSRPIAKVTQRLGSAFLIRDEIKVSINPGTPVFSGDQIFVEQNGQVDIIYPDKSIINLRDQSYIKLVDRHRAKHIHLYAGLLSGDIQKQPHRKPMQIITEDSKATVLGTQFEIHSSDVSTLLEVKEGVVRMEQPDRQAADVAANNYAISKSDKGIAVRTSGTPIYRSPLITASTPGQGVDIEVDLQGAEKIYLVTGNGNDNNRYDHVVWLNPEIIGAETQDLTQYTPVLNKSGWHQSRINTGLYGGPIRVNGKEYEKGLSTHATSVIAYDLPAGSATFRCRAALLDSGTEQTNSIASVHFEIYTELPDEKLQKLKIRKKFY